jgi:hypothetical protein
MTEAVALLSVLRQRDVKLWIEHDQLKCSAPAGALDAEMRTSLASQKDQLLALLRQSDGIPGAPEEPAPPLLPTISRQVGLPVIPARNEQISDFVSALRSCGYDLARCAARLGVFPRLGVNFWEMMRSNWKPQSNDPIDNLITLFIDGHPVSADLLARQISAGFVDTALEMRLVEKNGHLLCANLSLFPCFGKYIVTDQAEKNTAINQVMWLWGESFILGGFVNRKQRRRGIDLGTGSGVHAILASDHCSEVIGADVSPRALAFSNFNAQLNGSKNIDFVLSDLLDSIDGSCDLLIANVPYAPDTAARAGDNFWSGGIDGTDLLRRVVEALPTRLERDGVAHINSLFPNPPGTQIKDHFDAWLGGKLGDWQVLDHTWAVPRYQDLLSDRPYEGNKSAWRFGVVSLRRSDGGNGWWKELAGRGRFFRPDGSCAVVADHELYQEAP